MFDDVAITLYADSTQTKEHLGTFIKFGNNFVWYYIKKDGTVEWNCMTWMSETIINVTEPKWNKFGPNSWWMCDSDGAAMYQGGANLTEEEKTMYASGTLPFTLVRKGANVYAFLNGKYVGMRNVGDATGASKVTVGLTDFGAVANARLSYLIETDISAYLAKCEGDSTFKYVVTGEHITVAGKKEGFKVNDFAEITIAVEEGYVITSFKINGQEVEPTMSFKKWVLDKNLADVTIDIVTAEYQPVAIEYTVNGLKPGYAQGGTVTLPDGKVKLENAFFKYELDLVGGKLTGNVAKGTYTLTYDGYKARVTVDDDLTKEIALERINNFVDNDIFGWKQGRTEQYVDGKATVTALGSTVMHPTIDTFDQVAFTTYLKKSNTGEVQGVFVRFGEKYISVVIKPTGSIEWNCDTYNERGKDNITQLTWNNFGENMWWMCDSDGKMTYQNGANLTEEEKAMFEAGTLPLTLVRNGANVYVFVNGKYIGVRNVEAHLGTELANGKVTAGLTCYGSQANTSVFTYLIETDISAYLAKCEGDSTFKYVVTGEHITVTGKKDGFKVNDFAEITIAVEEGFTIKSVKVDNNEVNASQILTFKRWVLVKDLANVVIELEVVENTNVNAEIAAEGLDGFEITFINGEEQINVTVVDGKATFAGFVGTWTAKTEYMGAEIELGNVVIHADGKGEISRIVNIFDQTSIANNWGDKVDNQHDIATNTGKVSGSGTILHKTRTSYDDVALTLYANKNATKEYIGLTMNFGNDYLWLALWVDGSNNFNRIQWIGSSWFQGDNPGNNNITDSTWNHFGNGDSWKVYDVDGNVIYQNGNGLTAEELTMLDEGKLPITLVRKGANVYLFVNGRYVGMRNVGDEIGARKVNVGLTNFGKIGNGELSYKIETDISAYLAKCEGDSTFKYVINGEHITVTGKKEGFKVNDFAEITIAVEEGFAITSFKINGQEVEPTMSFKKWILDKNLADVTIDIETAEYQPVTINYTVNGLKPGYKQDETVELPDGKVKLENAIFKYELNLVGGKLTGNVAKGNYTLTYNGYKSATVTVDDDLNKSITLNHINFESKDMFGWNNNAEESYVGGKASIALKGTANTIAHQSTDQFDDVAITLYADSTQTKEFVGTFIKFGNSFVWYYIKKDGTVEWNCDTGRSSTIINVSGSKWNNFGANSWWMCDSDGNTLYQHGANLTEEEKTMYANGTLPFTLVRKGANVYAFLNGKYIGMRNVGEEIGASKVTVGLTDFGAVTNGKLSYTIETDISAYLAKCEGDSSFKYVVTGEHVTVTGKTEGFKLNDIAEITIAAAEGFTITSVKVNGVETDARTFKKWLLSNDIANVTIEVTTAAKE